MIRQVGCFQAATAQPVRQLMSHILACTICLNFFLIYFYLIFLVALIIVMIGSGCSRLATAQPVRHLMSHLMLHIFWDFFLIIGMIWSGCFQPLTAQPVHHLMSHLLPWTSFLFISDNGGIKKRRVFVVFEYYYYYNSYDLESMFSACYVTTRSSSYAAHNFWGFLPVFFLFFLN